MGCDTVRPNLSALVDGELSSSEERSAREHLEGCEDCSRTLEALRGIASAVRRLPRPVVGSGLLGAVNAALDRGAGEGTWVAGAPEAVTSLPRAAAPHLRRVSIVTRIALAAGVLVAAGALVFSFMEQDTGSPSLVTVATSDGEPARVDPVTPVQPGLRPVSGIPMRPVAAGNLEITAVDPTSLDWPMTDEVLLLWVRAGESVQTSRVAGALGLGGWSQTDRHAREAFRAVATGEPNGGPLLLGDESMTRGQLAEALEQARRMPGLVVVGCAPVESSRLPIVPDLDAGSSERARVIVILELRSK
jgi:hypothetical protein